MNVELQLINDNRPWVIKRWDVYSGKFYLGHIIKREAPPEYAGNIGGGTRVYQCYIMVFSKQNIGYKHKWQLHDLKSAKAEFIRIYMKLVTSLTKDI